jgi:signal transduction histidine kinase
MQKEKLDLIISILSASLFVLLLAVSVFMFFRIYLKRKNSLLLEKERMRIQFDQTLLQSKLEIQEETFTYISRELHDNIGQVLSMARLNLNTLDLPDLNPKIDLIDEMLGKSITDLRNLGHSLDSDRIRNNGWVNEVEKLLVNLRKTGRHKVYFSAEQELPSLGKGKPIILFRMIQEIINNIIKHAGAV